MKRIKKNILLVTILGMSMGTALLTLAGAADSMDSNVQNSQETKLTSEEIDKIIEDLKMSANIDNITEKLDEITKRAQLSGNNALRDYAINSKQYYEVKKQLDTLSGLIEAMKKKNGNIEELDMNLKKILAVNTIIEDLQGAVSDETLLVLESLTEENIKELQSVMAEIEELIDLNDVKSISPKHRSLLDIIILDECINKNMFNEDRLKIAEEALAIAIVFLKSYEKQKYIQAEYENLLAGSEKFANTAKKAESVLPEQVILFEGAFNMKKSPIMYDGHILLAIDDLYQYIDAKIEYMFNSPAMIIKSLNKVLEITSGKNVAYINDAPANMTVPILTVGETIYMSGEFFAQTYGMSYRYLPKHDTFVLYKNLNQLKNPSTPNEVNRD